MDLYWEVTWLECRLIDGCRLVFGSTLVRMPAETSTALTDRFRGFSRSLQTTAGNQHGKTNHNRYQAGEGNRITQSHLGRSE